MEEIDIKEIFYELWKKKLLIIVLAIIGIACGMLYTLFVIKPMYNSSITLVLSSASGETSSSTTAITSNDLSLNSKLVSTYSEIIRSRSVANTVIDSLKLNMSESEFIRNIKVESKSNTEVLLITVSNQDPNVAASIANALSEAFAAKVKEVYKIENISVIDDAVVATKPYNVDMKKNIILFGCAGLFLGAAIVLFVMYVDNTAKDPNEVERLLGMSVIAVIPKYEEKE